MNALRSFDRISDLSKPLKDEHRGHKNYHMSYRVKVRQNVSQRPKARQMCVDDDDENAISENPALLIHRTFNNAQNTQHKLGVAFSYLERNKIFFNIMD